MNISPASPPSAIVASAVPCSASTLIIATYSSKPAAALSESERKVATGWPSHSWWPEMSSPVDQKRTLTCSNMYLEAATPCNSCTHAAARRFSPLALQHRALAHLGEVLQEAQHVERAGGCAGGKAGEVGVVHGAPACKLAPTHVCVQYVCGVCAMCACSAYSVPGSRTAGRGCESGSRPGSPRAAAK
eukprot:scaffold23379_cov71-Phaeocystis_antarctica.AAC.6